MIFRRILAIFLGISLLTAPASGADRKPLVLGATGQQQQIQSGDTLSVPAAKVTGISGSTQCVQASSAGLLSGTGSACGSGGGGGTTPYEAGPPTPPTVASLTWVNQSTSTATNGSRALIVQTSALGANTLSLLVKSAPATPFDIYMRAQMVVPPGTTAQLGLVLRNSSSGKLIDLIQYYSSGNNLTGQRYNSATSFASTWYTGGVLPIPAAPWIRFNVTSTTITGYVSQNGLDWISIGTEAQATFLSSVDQIGIEIGAQTGANAVLVSYFSTTAPS